LWRNCYHNVYLWPIAAPGSGPLHSTVIIRGARQPVLDGIRAVAILLVVAGHSLWPTRFLNLGLLPGATGVAIFFVLSGYLISSVLPAEERTFGNIDLGRFYKRRVLRIFPAFYAFLMVLAVCQYLGAISIDRSTWIASLFYFRNISGGGWETGHLWSLALEEQFYLVWPMAMAIIPKRYRLPSIILTSIVLCCWRAYVMHDPASRSVLYLRPDLRMDTFLIGASFAVVAKTFVNRASAFPVFCGLVLWLTLGPVWFRPIDSAVEALLIGGLICWLVNEPEFAVSRALSSRAPVVLGIASYSVYLWQQLFLGPRFAGWSLPALGVVSALSYVVVEKPFMRLRTRLTVDANPWVKLELQTELTG
jgi:peptidoglycan/LPS O-acetylase OafA/YrhL